MSRTRNFSGFLPNAVQTRISVASFSRSFVTSCRFWLATKSIRATLVVAARLRQSEKQMPLARSRLGSPMAVIQGAFLRELAKFGDGFYELGVFKFDLRASGRP
jgi:hypothetical protein